MHSPDTGDPALVEMRVILAERGAWRLSDGEREFSAVAPGRLRHKRAARDLPVVGDWVLVRPGAADQALVIEAVVPRRSELARRDPDQKTEQVLVANVELAIIVMGADGDFNPRRLERYLALVAAAGVRPLVVVSKVDLCPVGERVLEIQRGGVDVVAANLLDPACVAEISRRVKPGETAVLLGSSGVGKSTLLNGMLGGDVQRTQPVRQHDSRGRHTTTKRQMFALDGGGTVIDTPGLRELELVSGGEGLGDAFPEIAAAALGCRFRDCRHDNEPGCEVRAQVKAGGLDGKRLRAYRKLAEADRRAQRPGGGSPSRK